MAIDTNVKSGREVRSGKVTEMSLISGLGDGKNVNSDNEVIGQEQEDPGFDG